MGRGNPGQIPTFRDVCPIVFQRPNRQPLPLSILGGDVFSFLFVALAQSRNVSWLGVSFHTGVLIRTLPTFYLDLFVFFGENIFSDWRCSCSGVYIYVLVGLSASAWVDARRAGGHCAGRPETDKLSHDVFTF